MAERHWVGEGSPSYWSDSGSWSLTAGGSGGENEPTSSDDVYFDSEYEQCLGTASMVCKSLTLNSGFADLDLNDENLTISGALAMSGGKLYGGSGTISVAGAINMSAGTFTAETSTLKLTNDANVTLSAGNPYKFESTAEATLLTNLTTSNNIDVTSSVLIANGKNITCGGTFSIAAGCGLNMFGTETITAPTIASGGLVKFKGDNVASTKTVPNWSYKSVYIDDQNANKSTFKFGEAHTEIENFGIYFGTFSQSAGDYAITCTAFIIANSGIFVGGSAAVTINGYFSMADSANFTSTSGILTTTANFTITAGTFTHNSGTLKFTSTTTLKTGGKTFSKVTVDSSGTVTLSTSAMIAAGLLTVANGTFDSNDLACTVGSLTMTGGILTGGASTISVGGDCNMGAGTFTAETSTLKITAASTVTLSAGNPYKFEVDASGKLVYLATALTTTNTTTVTAGTFFAAGQNITSGSTFSVASGANLQLMGQETITTPTLDAASWVYYVGNDVADTKTIKNWTYGKVLIYDYNTNKSTFQFAEAHTEIKQLNVTLGTLDLNDFSHTTTTLTVNGGTLLGGTGTLSVAGNCVMSSGTFTAETSTLNITAASTVTLSAGNPYKFSVDATGVVVTFATALTTTNTTTITAGTLSIAGNNLTSGSTFTIAAAGTLKLLGTETVTTPTIATGGTVEYAATSGTVTLKNWTYKNLKINGAGGTFKFGETHTGITTFTVTAGTFSQAAGDYAIGATTMVVNGGTFTGGATTLTVTTFTVSSGVFNAGSGTDALTTLNVTGGTFNGDTSTINVTTFSMTNGVFVSTTGNLTLPTNGGSFTLSGGTFNQTAGTVVFGNASTGTMTLNITAGSFWNVTFNGSSSNTINITGTIDVNGTTRFSECYIMSGGTIAASGNVVSTSSNLYVASTVLKFDGVNQTFNASGGTGRVPRIEIASSGTLTISDTMLVANADSTVAWKYTSGAVSDTSGTVRIGIPGNRTCTIDSGAQTFPNVVFAIGSAGNLTITGTMDINGNLTFASTIGYLQGGTIRLAGNLTCNQYVTTGSTCAFIFDGGNSQTIDASAGRFTSALVTVDKTVGTTATLASALSLNSSGQDFTITSGTLDLAGFGLTVNDALSVGASGTIRLKGTESINKTPTLASGSTVVYYGDNTGTTITCKNWTYKNLTINDVNASPDTFKFGEAHTGIETFTVTAGTFSQAAGDYAITCTVGMTINGGTFTGGSATLTIKAFSITSGVFNGGSYGIRFNAVNSSWSMNGGTFNAGAGTYTMSTTGHSWTYTSGTWNKDTSTVAFSGTSPAVTVTGSMDFYKLTITGNTGSVITIDAATTLTVYNTLTSGVSGGINGGTISAKGDITVSYGSMNGTTALNITGTGPQILSLSGTGTGVTLPITINKSDTLTVGDISIHGDWTYTAGAINATGKITFTASAGTAQIITGNHSLNNIQITDEGSGANTNLAAGTELTVANAAFTYGYFHCGAGAKLKVTGNVLVAGISGSLSTGNIEFSGGNAQTYERTSGTIPGGTITIDKSANGVTLLSAMSANKAGQDLTITNGTLDLAGYTLTVNDALTIGASGTLKLLGTETITEGSLTNSGTVQYYDSGTTAVLNNLGTTFTNITFGESKTHNVTAGTTITVAGAFASDGTSSTRSILRSTTPGSYWNLNLSGTSTLTNKVDVQDSNASSGSTVLAYGSVNSGHNINWNFVSANARYCVGATWNTTASWSLATGGVSGASVPTSTRDAVFDDWSPSCGIDATVSVLSMRLTNLYANTLTQNAFAITAPTWAQAGGTFDGSSNTLTVTTFTLSGGVFNAGSGTDNITTLNVSGGTFNGDTSAINTTTFSMTSGTFTSTSGIWQFPSTSSLTVSGGTFNQVAGTVNLGIGTNGTVTLNTGSGSFNNVTVSLGSAASLAITGTFDVNGTLTFANCSAITGGTIAASGNVVSTNAVLSVASGTLKFDGAGAQSFSAGGGVGQVPKVELANTGGTLTINDTMNAVPSAGVTLWKYTSGTVSDTSGTVRFGRNSNQSFTIDSGAQTFPNVQFNVSGGANATITGTMDINGNLSFIAHSGYLYGGTITVAGNVTSAYVTTTGSTCALILDGGNSQTINITGRITSNTMTINKTVGTVASLIANLSLSTSGQDLVFTSGILDLAGYDLTVNDDMSIDVAGILTDTVGGGTATAVTITNSGTIKPTASLTVTRTTTGSDFTIGTITKDAGSDATLTLKSGRGIIANSAITSSSNKLGLVLNSRYADAASGQINITAAITTNGGNVTMGGGSGAIGVNSGYAIGSSGSSDKAFGVYISGPVTAGGGNIIVNGQGYNTTTDLNHGVSIDDAVSTTGTGTIDIYGIGKGTSNSGGNYGVSIIDGSVISVDGNLTINATGGGAGTGMFNVGIVMANSTIKTTGSGDVSITAVGGPGTGISQHGIYLFTDSSIQTTGTGNIIISATTGLLATGGSTLGLTLSSATSSIVGAKDVTIIATSLGVGGQYNYGLNMVIGSSITTVADGNISITATGGNSTSNDNYGLRLRGPISTTGTGTIDIIATGGGITNSGTNYGLYGSNAGYISAENGDITITGTGGGAGVGTNNRGVYLTGAGTYFKTTGSGNLTVNGVRGGGDTATNYGLYLEVANALQTTAGNITVNTDTLFLTEANDINSAAALTIAPYTAATTVGVVGGAGTLNISTTYLGYLGYTTLQIGNSDETGTMTIAPYAFWTKPVSFVVKSTANIVVESGAHTVSSTGSFTFAGNVDFNTSVINMGGDMTLTACTTVAAASADFIADGSGAQAIRLAGSKWLTITVTNPDATTVTFYDGFETDELVLTTPGSRIKFESTKIFKVNTLLQIFGTSGSHVTIEATSSGSAWILNAICPVRECGYVNVKDSNNNSGVDIYCSFGTNNGGNTAWVFVDKYIWDGLGVGNLASTKENWVGDIAPVTANAVLFNGTGTKDCTWDLTPHFSMMEVDTGYAGTLTLTQDLYLTTNFDQQDGTIVLTGGCTAITIEGNMTIGAGGTFTAAIPIEVWQNVDLDSGATIDITGVTFTLNGWAAQSASFGGFTLDDLQIPNTHGFVSLLEGFTANTFTINPGVSVKFGAGETFTFTDITWDGTAGNLITLRSTVDETSWLLVVPALGETVEYVDVKNSNANGGGRITATTSINRGGNFNWNFGLVMSDDSMGRLKNRNIERMLLRMLPNT